MLPSLAKKVFRAAVDNMPDRQALMILYWRNFGRLPNLTAPITFNEKLNWRKLYQRDPRFTVLADKVAVKDEVARIVGKKYVIPTLWSGTRPEDIPFDQIKPPYVIKVNHSNGGNYFVNDPTKINRLEIVRDLNLQLKYSHDSLYREWGYVNIPRMVFAEKMIDLGPGIFPIDYKFFVYDGQVRFIQLNIREHEHVMLSFHDADWNKLPVELKGYDDVGYVPEKPPHLSEMIEIAERLGADFDFVRIDLYDTQAGPLFGEATFYPNAGIRPFSPDHWDRVLGAPWNIRPYLGRAQE